jgi:uncharacterized protein (DUF952 family)
MSLIYKILPKADFEAAMAEGFFSGAGIDLADGYIHFSGPDQAQETARLHFRGKTDLVVFSVETEGLGDALKWEASRGGQLFAHLYARLPMDRVIEVVDAPLDTDGVPRITLLPHSV